MSIYDGASTAFEGATRLHSADGWVVIVLILERLDTIY